MVLHRVSVETMLVVTTSLAGWYRRTEAPIQDLRVLMLAHHIGIAPNDQVRVRVLFREFYVGIECELVAQVMVLRHDMMDDAVHRKCALKYWWSACYRISLVVDSDTCPSELILPRRSWDDSGGVFP